MKKLQFLSAFILFATIVSCSSNDPIQNTVTQNDLLGQWNVYSMSINSQTANVYASGQTFSGNFSADASNINASVLFKENPNTVTTDGSFTANYSLSALGQSYADSYDVTEISDYITNTEWSLDDNTIAFTNQNQTILADIISLRNDTLYLQSSINYGLQDINHEVTYAIDSLTNVTVTIDSVRVIGNAYLTLTK